MCGIVGIISCEDVVHRLVDGLKRLEYRGYDSSGIATLHNNAIDRRRSVGKLDQLVEHLDQSPLQGTIGIGHTRWATHGGAVTDNAHPHANDIVAVVHNGIIENFSELKKLLQTKGYVFESETDTEVVVHLVTDFIQSGLKPLDAVNETLKQLRGAFALVIMFQTMQNQLIVTRKGSPLVIGLQDDACYVGSDALALAPWTDRVIYLEEGDVAVLSLINQQSHVAITDHAGIPVERRIQKSKISADAVSKGTFNHYMLKEIYEQPTSLAETLGSLMNTETLDFKNTLDVIDWSSIQRIQIVACGTSYYAGLIAKYWFERYAGIGVDVDIASEFRYRHPLVKAIDLGICISQSGETIDTLSAIKLIKEGGRRTLGILNVSESSIGRLVDNVVKTEAGPEIGVASTKAFTAQVLVLSLLALHAAKTRRTVQHDDFTNAVDSFVKLPGAVSKILGLDADIQQICDMLTAAKDVLYLGRGTNYPIAMEGALKLKEISYIHAEGYPAGELKHGPIALIDRGHPVIVIMPFDEWFEKTLSNVQEVIARGAHVIAITDDAGQKAIDAQNMKNVSVIGMGPTASPWTAPILYTLPVQLLAYYTAYFKGTDVDQPRNLAKSVTVE